MDDFTMTERQFQEMLPFYVNGTLDEGQSEQMRFYMQTHPHTQLDFDFLKVAKRSMLVEASRMDPLEGYAEFKKRLDATPLQKPATPGVAERWAAARSRLRDWGLSPAMAVLTLIVGGQLAWNIGHFETVQGVADGGPAVRSMPHDGRKAELKILVKSGVPFEAVTRLLLENNCKITWGPSQQGEYWLIVDQPGKARSVADRLGASPLLDNVLLMNPS